MLGNIPGRLRDTWADVLPGELDDLDDRLVREIRRGGGLPGLPAGRTAEEEVAMRLAARTVDPRTGLREGQPVQLAPTSSNRRARPEDLAGPVRRFVSPVSGETGEPVVGPRTRASAEQAPLSQAEAVLAAHLDLERTGARRKNLNPGEGRWDDAALEVLQTLDRPEQMLSGNPDIDTIPAGRANARYSPATQELVDVISEDQGRRARRLGSLLQQAELLQRAGGASPRQAEQLAQQIQANKLRTGEMFVDGMRVLTPVVAPEQQLLDLHPLAVTGPDYAQQRIDRAQGANSISEGVAFETVGADVAAGDLRIPRNADPVIDDIRIQGMDAWPTSGSSGLTYGEAELRAQANADGLGPLNPDAISLDRKMGRGYGREGDVVDIPMVARDGSIRSRYIDPNVEIDGQSMGQIVRDIREDTKTPVITASGFEAQVPEGLMPGGRRSLVNAILQQEMEAQGGRGQAQVVGYIPRVGGSPQPVYLPTAEDGRRPQIERSVPVGRDASMEVPENLLRVGSPLPSNYDDQRARTLDLLGQFGIRAEYGPVHGQAGASLESRGVHEMVDAAAGRVPGVRLRELGTTGPASPLPSSLRNDPRALQVVRRDAGGQVSEGEVLLPERSSRAFTTAKAIKEGRAKEPGAYAQATRVLPRWSQADGTGVVAGPAFAIDGFDYVGEDRTPVLTRRGIEQGVGRRVADAAGPGTRVSSVDNPATVQAVLEGLSQGRAPLGAPQGMDGVPGGGGLNQKAAPVQSVIEEIALRERARRHAHLGLR